MERRFSPLFWFKRRLDDEGVDDLADWAREVLGSE